MHPEANLAVLAATGGAWEIELVSSIASYKALVFSNTDFKWNEVGFRQM